MKKIKKLFTFQAIFSIVLGAFLILNTQVKIIGAAIGTNEISNITGLGFGAFFLLGGTYLIYLTKKNY